MKLKDKRILLTGAAGGIGAILAERLVALGARVALVDLDIERLADLELRLGAERCHAIGGDISSAEGVAAILGEARRWMESVDVLVNLAGVLSFRHYTAMAPSQIETLLRVNLVGPALLIRAVLPDMVERRRGQIVNIGSTFGSIGFACFAAYSASKFGLRGLSEALRRELADTGVTVTYIAPRAVRTHLNPEGVYAMGQATGMRMDDPQIVVDRILHGIEDDAADVYIGWPEKLFVRINGLLPRLVDRAVAGQTRAARRFAGDTGLGGPASRTDAAGSHSA